MKLSKKANERVQYLTAGKNGEPKGKVAAVDPETGEYFVGRTIAEAVREGRLRKDDPKATFFFVRIGSPAMHILKSVGVQGAVDEAMVPHLPAKLVGGRLLLAMGGDMSLLPDTGFSGGLGLDPRILGKMDRDFVGEMDITLAGNVKWKTRSHLVSFGVERGADVKVVGDVAALELEGEMLLGMEAMAQVAGSLVVQFRERTVALAD